MKANRLLFTSSDSIYSVLYLKSSCWKKGSMSHYLFFGAMMDHYNYWRMKAFIHLFPQAVLTLFCIYLGSLSSHFPLSSLNSFCFCHFFWRDEIPFHSYATTCSVFSNWWPLLDSSLLSITLDFLGLRRLERPLSSIPHNLGWLPLSFLPFVPCYVSILLLVMTSAS